MAKSSAPIDSISDTALWVAVYRAMETDRPDALFRDPYARFLAGERGEEIVRTIPRGKSSAWAMITRTAALDEMLLKVIREKRSEIIVNIAAGLDMRPFRLDLPSSLRWYEVDLPAMIDYKEAMVGNAKPACRLERIKLDLADREARAAFLVRLKDEGGIIAFMTEGLLVYLSADQVSELARDLASVPGAEFWLADISSPPMLKYAQKTWNKSLQKSGARMQFGPKEGADFFAPLGWKCIEFRSFILEAQRLNRTMPLWRVLKWVSYLYPKKVRAEFYRAGLILLERFSP